MFGVLGWVLTIVCFASGVYYNMMGGIHGNVGGLIIVMLIGVPIAFFTFLGGMAMDHKREVSKWGLLWLLLLMAGTSVFPAIFH